MCTCSGFNGTRPLSMQTVLPANLAVNSVSNWKLLPFTVGDVRRWSAFSLSAFLPHILLYFSQYLPSAFHSFLHFVSFLILPLHSSS